MKALYHLVTAIFLLTLFSACSKNKSAPTPVVQPINIIPDATVTGISASSGVTGSTLVITGTNFGTKIDSVQIYLKNRSLNYVKATVLNIKTNEITISIPAYGAQSANVIVKIGSQKEITGPVFFNTTPYAYGGLTFTNQEDIDDFVSVNKNRTALNITGQLVINGANITSVDGLSNIVSISDSGKYSGSLYIKCPLLTKAPFLANLKALNSIDIESSGLQKVSFDNLKNFNGDLYVRGNANLTTLSFPGLVIAKTVLITGSPNLSDLTCLSNLTSVVAMNLGSLNVSAITMDQLTSISKFADSDLTFAQLGSLKSLSLKSLINVGHNLSIINCPLLDDINFASLTSVKGRLMLNGTATRNLSMFKSLKELGALNIRNNPVIENFSGMENITVLTAQALNSSTGSGPTNSPDLLNGLVIMNNPKLTSLAGLQNLTDAGIVNISNNDILNDLCLLKAPLLSLSAKPPFVTSSPGVTSPVYFFTVVNNGNLKTQQDALNALASCK